MLEYVHNLQNHGRKEPVVLPVLKDSLDVLGAEGDQHLGLGPEGRVSAEGLKLPIVLGDLEKHHPAAYYEPVHSVNAE